MSGIIFLNICGLIIILTMFFTEVYFYKLNKAKASIEFKIAFILLIISTLATLIAFGIINYTWITTWLRKERVRKLLLFFSFIVNICEALLPGMIFYIQITHAEGLKWIKKPGDLNWLPGYFLWLDFLFFWFFQSIN